MQGNLNNSREQRSMTREASKKQDSPQFKHMPYVGYKRKAVELRSKDEKVVDHCEKRNVFTSLCLGRSFGIELSGRAVPFCQYKWTTEIERPWRFRYKFHWISHIIVRFSQGRLPDTPQAASTPLFAVTRGSVCISRSNSAAVCRQHCWWLRIPPQSVGHHQCALYS